MGVHDNHIMAVMIKAIQEQQEIIKSQKEKINKLEQENLDKDNKIKNIENQIELIFNKISK